MFNFLCNHFNVVLLKYMITICIYVITGIFVGFFVIVSSICLCCSKSCSGGDNFNFIMLFFPSNSNNLLEVFFPSDVLILNVANAVISMMENNLSATLGWFSSAILASGLYFFPKILLQPVSKGVNENDKN